MTFRKHTDLQEKSRNAAHTSTITHSLETNGGNQLNHSWRWIAAGDGKQEMDSVRTGIKAGYGLRPDMDGSPEVLHRRWITGDGSRETYDNGSLSFMKILRLYEVK